MRLCCGEDWVGSYCFLEWCASGRPSRNGMEFGFFLIPLVIDAGEWAVSCLEWSGCRLDRPLKSSFHFEEGMCIHWAPRWAEVGLCGDT